MDTLGERLRHAIEEWGSIRSFQKAMEERLQGTGVDGYSYPSINDYLKDAVSPRHQFIVYAADVLGVRVAWLATGEGEMTEAAEEERRRRHYGSPDEPILETVTDRHPWLGQLTIGVQQTFMDVLRALEIQVPGGRELDALEGEGVEEERLELADDLVFLLTVPLRAWGVPFPELLREEATVSMDMPGPSVDLDGYLRQVLGALATVMTTRTPGDRWNERPGSAVASLRRAFEAGDLPDPKDEERERAARIQAALDERMEERRQKIEEEGLGFEVEDLHPDTEQED